jgi:hypothetical protein
MINDLWYKNAIFYCLSVATYMDANGDGVGDFQGLLRRSTPDMAPLATLSSSRAAASSEACASSLTL